MPTNYYCTSDMFGFNTSQLSHLNLDYVPKPVRHTGTRTVDVVLRLKEEFPALETLVIILKQFLHEHDLKETFTGGLGSYCLVLMVASFLQIYLALCPSSPSSPSNYGLLLLGFLELYGVKFDFGSTGISLKGTGNHFEKRFWEENFGRTTLLIVDPCNPKNNIASNTFGMENVKKAFATAHQQLLSSAPSFLSDPSSLPRFPCLSRMLQVAHHISSSSPLFL